jgi:hypothetical protein
METPFPGNFSSMTWGHMNTVVGEDIIDTCCVYGSGWESAVVNEKKAEREGCSVVLILQQYASEKSAKRGHDKWVRKAQNGTLWKEDT